MKNYFTRQITIVEQTGCIVCHRTDIPHKAAGKCKNCYTREQMRRLRAAKKEKVKESKKKK